MKTLILTRHAKTEQLSTGSTKPDFERVLKPRGHHDCELVGSDLKSRHVQPCLLISSKAKRAKQTAEIFAGCLGIDKKHIIFEQFLYDGYTPSELLNYLAQFDQRYASIMIVGHNPEIAMTSISLTGSHEIHVPTTGTIAISFSVNNWKEIKAREGKVEWYITPKMLK